MTHTEVVEWYSDLRQTSWIFPDNSRTVNLMSEDEDIVPIETVTNICETCFVKEACFESLCQLGICKENHYQDFLKSPTCEEYICNEEVNGIKEED